MSGLTTEWKKATRSQGNSGCVEVRWKKSSRSQGSSGCVEVRDHDGWVEFRDSKDLSGPILSVSVEAHTSFVTAVKTGAFDLA